jgi:hypothetical protein
MLIAICYPAGALPAALVWWCRALSLDCEIAKMLA